MSPSLPRELDGSEVPEWMVGIVKELMAVYTPPEDTRLLLPDVGEESIVTWDVSLFCQKAALILLIR